MNKRRRHLKAISISLGVLCLMVGLAATVLVIKGQASLAAGVADSGVVLRMNNPNTTNNTMANNPMTNSTGKKMTIRDLRKIKVIGSTADIWDANNNKIHVDANPYDVAIAPVSDSSPDGLKAGDLVVTNFGANDTGKTLVRFPGMKGPGHLFNRTPNPWTKGPADEAFNTRTGADWVANFSGNNVQIFDPEGHVQKTLLSNQFRHPWGMAYNRSHHTADGAIAAFFTTNADDASILRIEIIPDSTNHDGVRFHITQIGKLKAMDKTTFVAVKWVPHLRIRDKQFDDVLLALDTANNRVAAFPNSSTRGYDRQYQGITIFQGQAIKTPGGMAINPLNGDLLIVNGGDNNLVELDPMWGRLIAIRTLDNTRVDAQGNGAALFGVTATADEQGNLKVFFTNDNTNTLNVLT